MHRLDSFIRCKRDVCCRRCQTYGRSSRANGLSSVRGLFLLGDLTGLGASGSCYLIGFLHKSEFPLPFDHMLPSAESQVQDTCLRGDE